MNSVHAQPLTSKPHYEILDGLRGVAAVVVLLFHLFEAHSQGNHLEQFINHGYLAVDFFFMLSGFVIGYAYDDRWKQMSAWTFFKRRFIRLHPMVVLGSIIGGALFYFQQAPCYPNMNNIAPSTVFLVMLLGCTLLPLPLKWDIRGWTEMHPLNGPSWSLYYEYIGNILYAYVFRKLSKKALLCLTMLTAAATLHLCLTAPQGDIVGGWALNWEQQYIGMVRLLFPFLTGSLIARYNRLIHWRRHAFWYCSILLVFLLSASRLGGESHLWINGLYEALCIILVFPVIVSAGAGGTLSGKYSSRICRFLGNISYPLYITHYPLVYIYTGWVSRHHATLTEGAPYIATTIAGALLLAFTAMTLYDKPIRKWLTNMIFH